MKILSIDGWHDGWGWTWNQWWHVADIPKEKFEEIGCKPRKLLNYLRNEIGILNSEATKGKVEVFDDGYNVVINWRSTGEPLYCIEYGNEY